MRGLPLRQSCVLNRNGYLISERVASDASPTRSEQALLFKPPKNIVLDGRVSGDRGENFVSRPARR